MTAPQYLSFIIDTVLPLIKEKYSSVKPQRDTLGILGSSFGGINSCFAIWTRSETFGWAGCMSSSFWWNDEDFLKDLLQRLPKPNHPVKIYLDSGDTGKLRDDYTQTIDVLDRLIELGFKLNETVYHYVDEGADHHPFYWGKRFNVPVQLMYPRKALNK